MEGAGSDFDGVSVSIPFYNVTLDKAYCTAHSCNARNGGRFELFVPVSPYMPTFSVHVRFV